MHAGQSPADAQAELKTTVSKDKNEILFSRFGINYNNLPERYRKGTVVLREDPEAGQPDGTRCKPAPFHIDIIGDAFWQARRWLLTPPRK